MNLLAFSWTWVVRAVIRAVNSGAEGGVSEFSTMDESSVVDDVLLRPHCGPQIVGVRFYN